MRLSARMQGSKVLLTGGCFEKSRRTRPDRGEGATD